ncbi:MAG: LacI family transcriptional regulator [Chloroflexi bacterium]|nr:LacI family transcriptional regulator [Chloroflexota bacterium]
MKTRYRLSDVARLAEVSTATVSAVINRQVGRNIRVSPETEQRVWDAIARLGYVVNPAARTLASGKNRILGIFTYEPIFPFQNHDYFYPFLLGIEEEAEAQGYNLLLFTHVTDAHGKRSIYNEDTNLLYTADGSVLLGLNEDKEELRRLQEGGYPFVYVGRRDVPDASISFTAADYTGATARLVEMMFDQGHRKVIYVCLPRWIESNQDREDGLFRAYLQRGFPLPAEPVLRIPTEQITPEIVRDLLAQGVTGTVVENDELAQALLSSLNALGLSVPRDFSIALCGNPHHAWDNSPDWTMFTIPRREMGSHAVRFLVERLNNPVDTSPRSIYLPCTIVSGQTIAAPPGLKNL